jgi:hypothetical protein
VFAIDDALIHPAGQAVAQDLAGAVSLSSHPVPHWGL